MHWLRLTERYVRVDDTTLKGLYFHKFKREAVPGFDAYPASSGMVSESQFADILLVKESHMTGPQSLHGRV